ncbi:hypothetical protein SUGI_0217770 [Cryptomeria japonica]|nr:hypothetical protein SUGI_0217770 [Cryptomeria japonica]
MALATSLVASPPCLQWRRRPTANFLPLQRRRSLSIKAIADPFVLELAEKLEESVLQNPKSTKTLSTLREKCTQEALSSKWPSAKDEPFRFTDLKFLKEATIQVASQEETENLDSNSLDQSLDAKSQRVVLIDGVLNKSLSHTAGLPDGVFAGSLSSLPETFSLPPLENDCGDLFSSLNGIGTRDLGIIFVPEGLKVEQPLYIVYFSRQGSDLQSEIWVSNPRLVVVLGKGAELNIVEEFRGGEKRSYWTNSVLQVNLEEEAKLFHSFVQLQKPGAVHIKWTFVQQGTSSSYNLVETSTGGRLNRHNLQIQQLGPDTVTELSTFHLAGENQIQDLHSKIILDHPRGYSRQLHKCIVTHSSGHAVFDGNVKVNRYAQLTDAGQLSRSLLMAPRATVNVKPNLQIVANDVKCSHGAAISDLDEDQLFYFLARGVDAQTARNALRERFVELFPVYHGRRYQ